MTELTEILQKFSESGWEVIAGPSKRWLSHMDNFQELCEAIEKADLECGNCGCEFDPLYKRCLEILKMLGGVAPCALLCQTCFGYCKGAIPDTAKKMYGLMEGWYEGHVKGYGPNPNEKQQEKLRRISEFNDYLLYLQKADCPGCRVCKGDHRGCIPDCKIPACTQAHKVAFCAHCPEFPCPDGGLQGGLREKWLAHNTYIKEHDLENFFETHRWIGHFAEHKEKSE